MAKQLESHRLDNYQDSKDWQLLKRLESELIDFDRAWTNSSNLQLLEALEFLKAQVRSQLKRIEQESHSVQLWDC